MISSMMMTLTAALEEKAVSEEYVKPKNVIVMVSDGMGLNDLVLANKFSNFLFDFGLTFENFKNKGEMTTNSLSGLTDSAASGTAMATGQKTENGFIGMKPDGTHLKNAPELARENGKKVGSLPHKSCVMCPKLPVFWLQSSLKAC